MTDISVSMGIILDPEGRILIAKRSLKKYFGGLWEFPGGKKESNESPSDALIRELKEELSIEIKVLRVYQSYTYSDEEIDIIFHPIHCSIVGDQLKNNEHEEVQYVTIDEIDKYDFAPPDYVAVDLLKREYSQMRIQIDKNP